MRNNIHCNSNLAEGAARIIYFMVVRRRILGFFFVVAEKKLNPH